MSRKTSVFGRIALLVCLLAAATQAALSKEEARHLKDAILKRQGNVNDAQVVIPRDCNRQITKESGCVTSPNWPRKSVDFRDCRISVLTNDNGERVFLTFHNFTLEGGDTCNHNNYVEISDVKSGRTNRLCGTQQPFTWLSDSNYFLVDMRAPSNKEFNRFNATYTRFKPAPVNACSKVFTADSGSYNISNPVGYLSHHHDFNPTTSQCELHIYAHPKERISVVFKHLVVEDCAHPLSVTDLLTNRREELCGEHTFISVTSDSNQVLIEYVINDAHNLQMYMEYSILQRPTSCSYSIVGVGETIPKFELVSPNYPQPYESNINCQIILRTSPGKVILLNFTDFVFEPPSIVDGKKACVNDFVEMRDVSTNRLYHLCDSYHNFTWTSDGNEVVITYKTNAVLDYTGFHFTSLVAPRQPWPDCMSITTTNPFVLTSLNYPSIYPPNSKCEILLHQLPGHYVTLDFQDFKLEGGTDCINDYLELTTLASNSTVRYCGTLTPSFSWTSDANEAKITFKTSSWIELSGFKAQSSLLSRPVRNPENAECNMLVREKSGRIKLPVNPDWPPSRGSDCFIVIHVEPREKILLHFVDFKVSDLHSDLDYVEIRDITVSGNEHRSRYTGHLDQFTWTSARNEIAIFIHDENIIASVAFTVDYEALPRSPVGCERVLTADTGIINWPTDFYPDTNDCDITIRTDPTQVIIVKFEELTMDEYECSSHSLRIQDRTTKRTDLFCSTQWEFSWMSESNEINIALKHEKYGHATVKAHYRVVPRPPVSALNQFFSSTVGILSSLEHNRDDIVGKNCSIIIQVNPEHRIVFNVTDFLIGNKQKENKPHLNCRDEFVEFKDLTSGRTSVYCGEFDIFSLSSDSNLISITFRINKYPTYSIFRARYRSLSRIEGCDHLSTQAPGMISTLGFPLPYPVGKSVCRHIISTQPGSLLTLKFEEFDLSPEGCTDFTKVLDLGTNRMTKICGSHPLFSWTSDTNEVMVEFHLNGNEDNHKGVKTTYERIQRSLIDECYIQLFDPTIPVQVPEKFVVKDAEHAYCQFYLHADPDHNIQLTVEEFEEVTDCSDSGIMLTDIATARTNEYCDIAHTFSWTAETNELHIGLFARKDTLPKFLARWRLTPRVAETIANDKPPYQTLFISVGDVYPVPVKLIFYTVPNRRIVVIILMFAVPNEHCETFPLTVSDSSSRRTNNYCEITRSQSWVSDSNEVIVDFHRFKDFHFQGGFYSLPKAPESDCNKVLFESDFEFESTNYPEFYPNRMQCDILIYTSKDLLIQVVFKEFWLEEPSDERCHDYLFVVDPTIQGNNESICGRRGPFSWTSAGNSLLLKIRTDDNVNQIGYRAEYTLVNRPVAAEYCNRTYTGPNGNIASPNIAENRQQYRDNVLCYYFLKGKSNERIFIDFHFFDVELQMPCGNDYLLIEDVASGKSNRICGAHPHLTWESDSNEVNITFITDDSQSFGGFNASYKMEIRHPDSICDQEFHQRSGTLWSPRYPSKYPNDYNCVYTIIGPTDHIIAVTFDYFNVEDSEACTGDYVEVSSEGIGRKQRFCGEKHGFEWKSDNNHAVLTFHSDHVVTKPGFSASYQVQEIENPSECGHTILTGNSGSFTSPGFPDVYRNNIDCKYTIFTEPDRIIIITFETLQLEAGTHCLHDYVELINYPESTGERRCNQIEGGNDIWTSTNNHVVINLHTDTSLVNTGFKATYTTVIRSFQPTEEIAQPTIAPCHTKKMSGEFDILTSPGFPDSYPSLTQCQTLVTVPKNHKVVITLFFMDIEEYNNCDWDYVQFTDVETGRSSERLCGSLDAPLVWESDSNEVKSFFKSDDILQRTGFYGTFHSVPIAEQQPYIKP